MKLFFSYGHDKNEEIVLRLKHDIEQRNHSVWIDKSKIKSGDDWRRSITSGILDSEFMMSFASAHSVRQPGVCLDELMIAVSVKGAQVQTVLLEADVIPPANIGYRQYIDMSSWKAMIGTDEFENWYTGKLNEIIDIIESPETARYAEEMEFLKEKLHPDLSSAKKDRLQQEYFCGREWLSERVREWLCNKDASRILLIDGAPGIGKSAFMAHEFIFNAAVGSILFCEWDNPSFNNLDAISRCMVFQLASKISDYRSQLVQYLSMAQQIEESAGKPESSEGVFRFLLLQQLRSLIDGDRPVVMILIDGIDELDDKNDGGRKRNAFAEILQQEIDNFPRWIRFVVTSRCDSRVTVPLQNVETIHMDLSLTENTRDVLQYLRHELDKGVSATDIDSIAYKCDGNFLYAKMAVAALNTGKLSVKELLNGNTGDLGFIYRRFFDRTFQSMDEYEEIYYPAIAALAVTEERIPEDTFRRITGWSKRKQVQYLKTLSSFLSSSRECLGLYHKSLQDWLMSEAADEYMIDEEDGFSEIAEACLQSYTEDMYAMNIYELKYLIPYLETGHETSLRHVLQNVEYAAVLMERAEKDSVSFQYEEAVILAKMAFRIYKNTSRFEKAALTGLFLADNADLMVHLEDAEEWCRGSLEIVMKDKSLVETKLPGDIWMRLSWVYFRQGKWQESVDGYKAAYDCYDRCRNISEEQREIKKTEAMMMCANAQRNATEFKEAIRLFESIVASRVYGMLKDSEPVLYTNILMYYGWALHSAGRYKDAEKYLEASEGMLAVVNLPLKDIAHIYYLRAVELFNQANYILAEEYCEKSLHYIKKAYGDNAVEVCSALNQLGAITQKQNNYEKAICIFWQSYEIRLNYYGENNLFTTISLRNYAKALLRQGSQDNLKQIGSIFENIKGIRENLAASGKGRGWLAQIYLDLAEYNRIIQSYPEAEMYANESRNLYEKYGSLRDVSTCEMQLGMIMYEEEKYIQAKESFERAIILSEKYYGTDHPYQKELKVWLEKANDGIKILGTIE